MFNTTILLYFITLLWSATLLPSYSKIYFFYFSKFQRKLKPINAISSRQCRRRVNKEMKEFHSLNNLLNYDLVNNRIIPEPIETSDVPHIRIPLDQNLSNSEPTIQSVYSDSIHINRNVNDQKPTDFGNELAFWVIEENISLKSTHSLLKLLRKHDCFRNILPIDPRTLLQTPRYTELKEDESGSYWHRGLYKGIRQILLANNHLFSTTDRLDIMINIDGLPISNSSGNQLWPILGCLFGTKFVFIIGIYHSLINKPLDVHFFLDSFVKETCELYESGFYLNGKMFKLTIKGLSADAPAKALTLNIKYHTGYHSCTKCFAEGEFIEKRLCFPDISICQKRTDQQFAEHIDDEFHRGFSPLEKVPGFGLVSQVPLDYQHLVCLGIVKKLLILWQTGALNVRLSSKKTKIISNSLVNCVRPTVPGEFQRKPRSLIYFRHWKATEFRQFLLYSGPVVLKQVTSREVYINFLSLHISIYILCSKKYCSQLKYLEYAKKLIIHFVSSFSTIYGTHHINHNMHNLLHIMDDVNNYGTLDNFSTFCFENYMIQIKKMLRKDDKPLQQIARRLEESDMIVKEKLFITNNNPLFCNQHLDGPLVDNSNNTQYRKVIFKEFTLVCDGKNNYVGLKEKEIVCIENIVYYNDTKICIIGKQFKRKRDLYTLPCKSSILDIYEVSQLSDVNEMWSISDIVSKYFIFNVYNSDWKAATPIVHTCE